MLVSLGTGELTRPFAYDEAKDWGLAEWAKPIIDVVFDGVSDATDHHLGQILGRGPLLPLPDAARPRLATTSTTPARRTSTASSRRPRSSCATSATASRRWSQT